MNVPASRPPTGERGHPWPSLYCGNTEPHDLDARSQEVAGAEQSKTTIVSQSRQGQVGDSMTSCSSRASPAAMSSRPLPSAHSGNGHTQAVTSTKRQFSLAWDHCTLHITLQQQRQTGLLQHTHTPYCITPAINIPAVPWATLVSCWGTQRCSLLGRKSHRKILRGVHLYSSAGFPFGGTPPCKLLCGL
jgi:hypothetical protein